MKKENGRSVLTTVMLNNVSTLEKDILKIRQLEAAYQELQQQFHLLKNKFETSHQMLQQLVHHISEGLIVISKEGIVQVFNPAAAHLTRLSIDLVLNGNYWDHFSDHFFGFSMKDSLSEMGGHRRIFLTLHHEIDLEVSTSSIPEKGTVLILSNRTEQQKLQTSLNHNERLKGLGEMAAILAHEIRNPLSGIEGFAQLLNRDLQESTQKKMVQSILEGTQILNHLLTQVLDYAKPIPLHFEPVDLVKLLQEAIGLMNSSRSKTDFTFTSHFEKYPTSLDKHQIKSVLLNLLQNAAEAGSHQVATTLASDGTIVVKDDGEGILPDDLKKIFTPFFTTKSRGTGLGLAQALAVVKGHGGTLEVFSEEGKGSQFTLSLNLCALKKY